MLTISKVRSNLIKGLAKKKSNKFCSAKWIRALFSRLDHREIEYISEYISKHISEHISIQ